MRRIVLILSIVLTLLVTALPALAQEGDPLAHSTLLPGVVGWVLAGLAVVLVLLFVIWTRRTPS